MLSADNTVRYYKKVTEEVPQGEFSLTDDTTVIETGPLTFEVHVTSVDRIYHIRADSKTDRDMWIRALEEGCRRNSSLGWAGSWECLQLVGEAAATSNEPARKAGVKAADNQEGDDSDDEADDQEEAVNEPADAPADRPAGRAADDLAGESTETARPADEEAKAEEEMSEEADREADEEAKEAEEAAREAEEAARVAEEEARVAAEEARLAEEEARVAEEQVKAAHEVALVSFCHGHVVATSSPKDSPPKTFGAVL